MQINGWAMTGVGEPLVERQWTPELKPNDVLVRVAGCGICHTDLGFLFDGVPTRSPLPLVLGHEIAGEVVETGEASRNWLGKAVVVPAVLPCGECDACKRGRPGICSKQLFVGSDIAGGFASHVQVPARGLCEVPASLADRLESLSVVADAVTTPYNAVHRSGLCEAHDDDVAIFIGVGGVGAFGVQIAASRGAHVVALDIDDGRLKLAGEHGAAEVLNVRERAPKDIRKHLRQLARERGWPSREWKIFETSGTTAGQGIAFGLLNFGATLMVVGYTAKEVTVRLSNLMAYEARALGVWGCPTELYSEAVGLIADGQVVVEPFIEKHAMQDINALLTDMHAGRVRQRPIVIPNS